MKISRKSLRKMILSEMRNMNKRQSIYSLLPLLEAQDVDIDALIADIEKRHGKGSIMRASDLGKAVEKDIGDGELSEEEAEVLRDLTDDLIADALSDGPGSEEAPTDSDSRPGFGERNWHGARTVHGVLVSQPSGAENNPTLYLKWATTGFPQQAVPISGPGQHRLWNDKRQDYDEFEITQAEYDEAMQKAISLEELELDPEGYTRKWKMAPGEKSIQIRRPVSLGGTDIDPDSYAYGSVPWDHRHLIFYPVLPGTNSREGQRALAAIEKMDLV